MPDFHTTSTTTPEPSFQCRHILTDGHRCGSPTLRQEHFCYYHHTTRKPIPKAELEAREGRKARRAAFDLPRPDDRSAIQAAIGEILLRLAANQLDPRRAGLLLYGLQIASLNLPPRQPAPDPAHTVEEVILDPDHGLIAPEQDFALRPTPGKGKTLEQILMEDWTRDEAREAEKAATYHQTAEDHISFILDDLQAVAQPVHPTTTGCPILCSLTAKGGVSSEARPHSHPRPNPRLPHPSKPHRDEWVHPNSPPPLAGCPILCSLIAKGGVSSEARPHSHPRPNLPHSSQPHRDEWVHPNSPPPPAGCPILCSLTAKGGVSSEARPHSHPRPNLPHSSQPHRDEWVHPNSPPPPAGCPILCSLTAKGWGLERSSTALPSPPQPPAAPFLTATP